MSLRGTLGALAPAGVRAVARRVTRRDGGPLPVPALADGLSERPRTVWVLTPDWDKPSGGVRKLYRTVEVLLGAGVRSAVVHARDGFRCTWFAHDVPVTAAARVAAEPGDLLVVPEVHERAVGRLPAGIGQVMFNQNVFHTVESLVADPAATTAAYAGNPDLRGVLTVSDHNRDALVGMFPGLHVGRVNWALDAAVWHPPAAAPGRRLAYMSRRRAGAAREVLALLGARGALAGWELVRIEGRSEAEVADLLRSCPVFLSFSEREGLGLPPLEALASGCHVVGFDGFAGREFFGAPQAVLVEDGDVLGMAAAAEAVLREVAADPAAAWARGREAAAAVVERYGADREREDLLDFFEPLLGG